MSMIEVDRSITTRPREREVVIARTFDAPPELVFRMWTEPEHFARWWGPKGFSNPVCELDARPGGAILVHMRAPDGAVYPLTGMFREVVPCERIVFTCIVADAEGQAALDEITTVTFAPEGGKTKVTVRSKAVGIAPSAHLMLAGMEKGWSQSFDRLADVSGKAASRKLRPNGQGGDMQPRRIVSRDEWLKARRAHLKNEKALTRMRDLVAAERRTLPWVKVEKEYVFDTAEGKQTLADLFGRNSQLIVHHFMWRHDLDQGCVSCSLEADHAEGALVHLENHDVSYVRVSRAPLPKLLAYRKRLGWKAKWVSSWGSDFNFDYHVSFSEDELAGKIDYNFALIDGSQGFSELPGLSVFAKNEAGEVFHTYSSYARGNEEVIGAFIYLDITPKGRNEKEIMDWVKRNDEYGAADAPSCCHSNNRS
jgi:predicted dithiol-disulfide oxidoreductase (DUF899 family)/uncharacterized protein YndB with AHSA1/START domain